MKILHTTDWLIGGGIGGPLFLNVQIEVIKEIIAIADQEKVDAVVTGGILGTDTADELTLNFIKIFLLQLNNSGQRPVFIVGGAHDSHLSKELSTDFFKDKGIFLLDKPNTYPSAGIINDTIEIVASEPSYCRVKLASVESQINFFFIPNGSQEEISELNPKKKKNAPIDVMLKDHLRTIVKKHATPKDINILSMYALMKQNASKHPEYAGDEGEPSITVTPSVIPPQIQYCGLAGVHKAQSVVKKPVPALYSGNPYILMPDIEKHAKYVAIIDIEPRKPVNFKAAKLATSKPVFSIESHSLEDAAHKITEYPDAYIHLTISPDYPLPPQECRDFLKGQDTVVAFNCPIASSSGEHLAPSPGKSRQSMPATAPTIDGNEPTTTIAAKKQGNGKEHPLPTQEVQPPSHEPMPMEHFLDDHAIESTNDIATVDEHLLPERSPEEQHLLNAALAIPALNTDATALLRKYHETTFKEEAPEEFIYVFEELLLEKLSS